MKPIFKLASPILLLAAMAMAMPAEMPQSDAVEGFQQLDSCLRRAAKALPRDAKHDELNENDRMVISHVLARSSCPQRINGAHQQGDTQGRVVMSGLNFLASSSACSVCDNDAVDLQTMQGQDTVNGRISACVLNADSTCCACMLKYIAGNYFDALTSFMGTKPPTTTRPTTTSTTPASIAPTG